jgi:hypothetical protein
MNRFLKTRLTFGIALCLGVMPFASATAAVINSDASRGIKDNDANNTGDSTLGSSGARYVGDSSNNDDLFASVFLFDITDDSAAITAAAQIFLEVTISTYFDTTPADFELVLLTDNGNADYDVINNSDYQAPGIVGDSFDSSAIVGSASANAPLNTTLSTNVTAFVKAATDTAVFRYSLISNVNDQDSNSSVFEFNSVGTLRTVVPEPSSLILASLGGLALMGRRRRNA